jgi:hypothetical protein
MSESGVGTERLRDLAARLRTTAESLINSSEALANAGEETRARIQLARGRAKQEDADELEAALAAPPAAVTDAVIEPSAVGSSMATASDDLSTEKKER